MLAVQLYDTVVAIHVMAVVVAFGVFFAYPVLMPWVRRTHPQAMPALHLAQERVRRLLVTPAMVVTLAAGVYLASDAGVWSKVWVSVPLVILVVLFGLNGAFLSPNERRLAELARRDLDRGGQLSPEYDARFGRVATVAVTSGMLVLVAIFFMVAKPGS